MNDPKDTTPEGYEKWLTLEVARDVFARLTTNLDIEFTNGDRGAAREAIQAARDFVAEAKKEGLIP